MGEELTVYTPEPFCRHLTLSEIKQHSKKTVLSLNPTNTSIICRSMSLALSAYAAHVAREVAILWTVLAPHDPRGFLPPYIYRQGVANPGRAGRS